MKPTSKPIRIKTQLNTFLTRNKSCTIPQWSHFKDIKNPLKRMNIPYPEQNTVVIIH